MAKKQNQILNNLGGPIFNPPQPPIQTQQQPINENTEHEKNEQSSDSNSNEKTSEEKPEQEVKDKETNPIKEETSKAEKVRETKRKRKKIEDDTPRPTSLTLPYSMYREIKLLTLDLDITMKDFILESVELNLKKYRNKSTE